MESEGNSRSRLRIGGRYNNGVRIELEKPGIDIHYDGLRFNQGVIMIGHRVDLYRFCPEAKKSGKLAIGQIFPYDVNKLEKFVLEMNEAGKARIVERRLSSENCPEELTVEGLDAELGELIENSAK